MDIYYRYFPNLSMLNLENNTNAHFSELEILRYNCSERDWLEMEVDVSNLFQHDFTPYHYGLYTIWETDEKEDNE